MSHSKDEEEVEHISCILDHLVILEKGILDVRKALLKGNFPSKEEVLRRLEKANEDAKGIVKRLDYMIKDMKGKNGK
jgi:hypothetical protein